MAKLILLNPGDGYMGVHQAILLLLCIFEKKINKKKAGWWFQFNVYALMHKFEKAFSYFTNCKIKWKKTALFSFGGAYNIGDCLRGSRHYFIFSVIDKLSGEQSGDNWRIGLWEATQENDPSLFQATTKLKGALNLAGQNHGGKKMQRREMEGGRKGIILVSK